MDEKIKLKRMRHLRQLFLDRLNKHSWSKKQQKIQVLPRDIAMELGMEATFVGFKPWIVKFFLGIHRKKGLFFLELYT